MADRMWPPGLRFSQVLLELRGQTRSGGQSFDGQEQIVAAPTARWVGTMTAPVAERRHGPPEEQDAVLAWRWMKAGGRAATILVPAGDGRGPAHRAGLVPCAGGVPFADSARFSDGTAFAQGYSAASLAAPAAMNATLIQIRLGAGLRLLPGMRFSMPGGRLHEIADLVDWNGADLWSVRVGPWTAADWPAGTVLNFDAPLCRMRLAADDSGGLTLSLNRFANPTIEFVEAF